MMHYASIIHQENQRLRLHIEQVLQAARLGRGEILMNKKSVDLNALIEHVAHTFEVRLQQRAGRLQVELNAGNPWVHADQDHIAQVLYNLLDNADKYSPHQPDITISTHDHARGVLVSIADRGVGIRQEEQKFIFDQFYRAPMGNRHDVKGFGLGLAYVRQIMMAHAGTVKVISMENEGSRFDLLFQTA
jgi:two-component system phosphate regulon sensor histidine kinase PhoR